MPGSQDPRGILIIRPSALGDVCRTVPVLVSLRRAWPEARIDWIVQDTFRDAVAAHPDLNEAIGFPRGRFARWWRHPGELRAWLRGLRDRRYDLVLDCQGLGRSGLMTWATRAPRRVGLRTARELGWLGYNVRHRPRPDLHTVDEMLSLLEPLEVTPVACLRLYVPDEAQSWWAERAESGRRCAVLAPTSRWESKRWPLDRWRALVDPLLERGYDRVVLIGSPDERGQVSDLTAAAGADERVVSLVGETTVGQTMAIIAGADLVVANDSAPLHMAVGLDRPCVALFGPTDPLRVGPYGRPESVVGATDDGASSSKVNFRDQRLGDRLMRAIGVDDVLAAVERVTVGT